MPLWSQIYNSFPISKCLRIGRRRGPYLQSRWQLHETGSVLCFWRPVFGGVLSRQEVLPHADWNSREQPLRQIWHHWRQGHLCQELPQGGHRLHRKGPFRLWLQDHAKCALIFYTGNSPAGKYNWRSSSMSSASLMRDSASTFVSVKGKVKKIHVWYEKYH